MASSISHRLGTLQGFQQQLAERLQRAQQSYRSTQSYLACATGDQRCLFDLVHTEEMLGSEQPTPVPFTHHWFLGLVSHRGQLIGVIDLDAFAGANPRPWQRKDHLLVLSGALPIRCAIRVSQMIGVIDRAQLKPEAPAVMPSIWAPTRFVHADGSHYIGIDLIKLMALPAFLDIARYPA